MLGSDSVSMPRPGYGNASHHCQAMTLAYAMARPGPRSGEKGAPTASSNFGVELFALRILLEDGFLRWARSKRWPTLSSTFRLGPAGNPPSKGVVGMALQGGPSPSRGVVGGAPHPPCSGRDPRGQNALQNPAEFRPNFSDFLTPAVQRPGGVGGLRPLP